MLKLAIATAAIGVFAAAVVWAASGGDGGRAKLVRELSVSCVEGTGTVVLKAELRLAPRPRAKIVDVHVSQGGAGQLARLRFRSKVRRLHVRKSLGPAQSAQVMRAALGGGDCRAGGTTRALHVRIVTRAAASRRPVGSARRSVRLQVGAAGESPRQDDPPGSTQPAPEPTSADPQSDVCAELVDRQPPAVDVAALDEASGLAFSRAHAKLLWTHNDSGGANELFAFGIGGEPLGSFELPGASNVDWEDAAVGPGPDESKSYAYVGDIGDNGAGRASISVYRAPEPAARPTGGDEALAQVDRQQLTYPDGPRDAETLLVDPRDGALYIVTKREARSRVYRFAGEWDDQAHELEYLGELDWGGAVAGDISASGNTIALKSYLTVRIYERAAGQPVWAALAGEARQVPYIPEPQGEALALCDDETFATLSEGIRPPLYGYAF